MRKTEQVTRGAGAGRSGGSPLHARARPARRGRSLAHAVVDGGDGRERVEAQGEVELAAAEVVDDRHLVTARRQVQRGRPAAVAVAAWGPQGAGARWARGVGRRVRARARRPSGGWSAVCRRAPVWRRARSEALEACTRGARCVYWWPCAGRSPGRTPNRAPVAPNLGRQNEGVPTRPCAFPHAPGTAPKARDARSAGSPRAGCVGAHR